MDCMNTKAVAFLRAKQLAGYELACSRCPIVLMLKHDKLEPLPKHRCGESIREFNIVMEVDSLAFSDGRIDESLPKELSRSPLQQPEYR